MQSFTSEQIIKRGEELGFTFKSLSFSIKGEYKSSDSLFNHRDVPHFNHLHKNLAGGYGNEGIYYGDVVSFIRYFKFLGISFPILTLMKDDGKNRVLETYSFFCFQFLKLNEEIDLPNDKCESKITYFVGCKNKIMLNIFLPFFKKMFLKSFNDYKQDDYPFLNRRAHLRSNGFHFDKDNIENFTFEDCLNIKKQNCFYNNFSKLEKDVVIDIKLLPDKDIKIFNDSEIMSFQIYKDDNLIKIYPVVCPHEGGYLGLNNKVGINFSLDDFQKSGCRVRCNIHNRRFEPIMLIDLNDKKETYNSTVYNFKIIDDKIHINLRNDLKKDISYDWSK